MDAFCSTWQQWHVGNLVTGCVLRWVVTGLLYKSHTDLWPVPCAAPNTFKCSIGTPRITHQQPLYLLQHHPPCQISHTRAARSRVAECIHIYVQEAWSQLVGQLGTLHHVSPLNLLVCLFMPKIPSHTCLVCSPDLTHGGLSSFDFKILIRSPQEFLKGLLIKWIST